MSLHHRNTSWIRFRHLDMTDNVWYLSHWRPSLGSSLNTTYSGGISSNYLGQRRFMWECWNSYCDHSISMDHMYLTRLSSTPYIFCKYSTIAPDSHILTPVFGSSKYGTWNLPFRSNMIFRFGLPRGHDT